MNRLDVILKTEAMTSNIIKNITGTTAELAAYYKECLIQAESEEIETLYFESIEFDPTPSTNFQSIAMIERTIMAFLGEHSFPKKVVVACTNDEQAKLYKVVYNFYFPGIKADRLDDDSWD